MTAVAEEAELQRQLTNIHIEEWLKEDFKQPEWWLLIGIILFIIIIWLILLDKSRIIEICLYAALAMIMFMAVSEYGEELTLWDYPIDVIPIFPPLSSINLIMLPLFFSLIYQRFGNLKNFILAAVAGTAIINFLLEPLLARGGFYELIHWHYYESTPIYFGIALFTRYAVIKTNAIVHKEKGI